ARRGARCRRRLRPEGADLSRGGPGGGRGAPARAGGAMGGGAARKNTRAARAHAPARAVRLPGERPIVAVDATFLADVGAYPLQGDGLTANTVNHLPGPYRVPHYRNVGTSVVTTKALNAAYRAAGRPEAVFVMERLMGIGARKLGLEPAEISRPH